METLLFVYNADSGKINGLLDSLHKAVSPSTYDCRLCSITFGLKEEKRAWKEFRENLEIETEFLHRDEFQKQYASKFGHKFEFPVVLYRGNKGLELLISREDINSITSVDQLMKLVNRSLGDS